MINRERENSSLKFIICGRVRNGSGSSDVRVVHDAHGSAHDGARGNRGGNRSDGDGGGIHHHDHNDDDDDDRVHRDGLHDRDNGGVRNARVRDDNDNDGDI